jgi:hypothetical protein
MTTGNGIWTLRAGFLTLAVLGACSSDSNPGGPDGGNSTVPSQLWLAPDQDELHLKLTGTMPAPY